MLAKTHLLGMGTGRAGSFPVSIRSKRVFTLSKTHLSVMDAFRAGDFPAPIPSKCAPANAKTHLLGMDNAWEGVFLPCPYQINAFSR